MGTRSSNRPPEAANRFNRGCSLALRLFRLCKFDPVAGRQPHGRGHDHVEDRMQCIGCPQSINLGRASRRLEREILDPMYEFQRSHFMFPDSLPEIYRLHSPSGIINELYHVKHLRRVF